MRLPPSVAQPSPRTVTSSAVRPIRRLANSAIVLPSRSGVIASSPPIIVRHLGGDRPLSAVQSSMAVVRVDAGQRAGRNSRDACGRNVVRVTAPSLVDRAAARAGSIESRASWAVALAALGIYSVSFGAPVITVVGLKQIAADLGGARSVPALAFSLAWLGAAVGGV